MNCGRRFFVVGSVAVVALAAGCSSDGGSSAAPTPDPPVSSESAAPSAAPSSPPGLEAMFSPLRGFRFEPVPRALERDVERSLARVFERLNPEIVVRRVATRSGAPVPVRVAAVSFQLSEGATIEQFASELGREFLGSNQQNSTPTLGGNGVYIREPGESEESVAFFLSEGLFVYVFGATVEAPTEIVARRLFEVACSRIECRAGPPLTG